MLDSEAGVCYIGNRFSNQYALLSDHLVGDDQIGQHIQRSTDGSALGGPVDSVRKELPEDAGSAGEDSGVSRRAGLATTRRRPAARRAACCGTESRIAPRELSWPPRRSVSTGIRH